MFLLRDSQPVCHLIASLNQLDHCLDYFEPEMTETWSPALVAVVLQTDTRSINSFSLDMTAMRSKNVCGLVDFDQETRLR